MALLSNAKYIGQKKVKQYISVGTVRMFIVHLHLGHWAD